MHNLDVAVIIIHGFCGETTQVEPLTNKLKQYGYDVYTPCLKGHTGFKKDLMQVTYIDWIHDVENLYLSLKEQYKEIILIGFSMGGLIALQIARKYDVNRVITLNTPIYLWNVFNIIKYIVFDLKNLQFDFIKNHSTVLKRYSFHAVKNFLLLLRETKKNLNEIKCDVLLNQAYDDETVRYKSVYYLYDHINSHHKKVKLYHHCNHMILQSEIAEEVMDDLYDYIRNGKIYNG
ncbi:MAG: esterase/lipase [Haloplasmataceae bacterium]|jgi:carboxylesterase|nr:esterase/lipase [Haloplasmataceae bacterium]